MKLALFICCILSYNLIAICVPGRNKRAGSASEKNRAGVRQRYVAEHKKIIEAAPYHEIHARMHGNNMDEFQIWPELDILEQSNRVVYCQKYILCIGSDDKVVGEDSILDIRPLTYYYKQSLTHRKSIRYHNTRQVRMLRCQVALKRVYRFVRGSEQYSAFYVQPTNASKAVFTIVDACRADTFNTMQFDYTTFLNDLKKQSYKPELKAIKDAVPYQEIHVKMYGDDLEAYKTWPELEDKGKDELGNLCYKYAKCMELVDSKSRIPPYLGYQLLRYYIADITESDETNFFNHTHYYRNRWVRTLTCPSGHKLRRFIRASDGYITFLIETVNNTYNKFTIVNACKTDVLNKITRKPISVNGERNKELKIKKVFSDKHERGANIQNYKEDMMDLQNNNGTSQSQKNKKELSLTHDNDAGLQDECDAEVETTRENAGYDSEATISDSDTYSKKINLEKKVTQ